jgi:hypothetical protein
MTDWETRYKLVFRKATQKFRGDVTSTHGTVLQLVRRVENEVRKLYMDSYFQSPRPFYDPRNGKFGSCGTMRPNKKDMPANFGPKQLKLKKKKQYIQGA